MTGPRHRRRSHTGPGWPDRALSLLLGTAVIVLLATATDWLSGMRLVLIKSGSMSPALLTGDIAVSRSTPSARIGPGDIVTFRHPGLRTTVTHRVVSTHAADGWVGVTTKGDANQVAEDWQVPATGRVGRVVARIPGAGAVIRAVSPRSAAAALAAAGSGCLGLLLLRRIWRNPARPSASATRASWSLSALPIVAGPVRVPTHGSATAGARDGTQPRVRYPRPAGTRRRSRPGR